MNAKINYNNLVRQLLPAHKRQLGRLRLLRAMVAPLRELFLSFAAWRSDARMQINMTGQVGVLEGYLRTKYGMGSIEIYPYADRGFAVGLREEGTSHATPLGIGRQEGSPGAVPLRGELEFQFDGCDFIVYVPTTDPRILEVMRIDIERYKQAIVTYKIVQQ